MRFSPLATSIIASTTTTAHRSSSTLFLHPPFSFTTATATAANNNKMTQSKSSIWRPSRFFSSTFRTTNSNNKSSSSSISSRSSNNESIISSSASSSSSQSGRYNDNDYIPVEVRRFSTTSINNKKGGNNNKSCTSSTALFSKSTSSFSTTSTNTVGDNSGGSSSKSSKLSSKRASAVINLLPSYLLDARSITQYHPLNSPQGALQLSVAENQLSELEVDGLVGIVEDCNGDSGVAATSTSGSNNGKEGEKGIKLVDVLSQLASSNVALPSKDSSGEGGTSTTMNVFERDMIYYQPTQGVPSLRTAMADYLQRLLVTPSSNNKNNKGRRFNPDNIVLGAGCNAVLENLTMCLTNPGEGVMIPTPYYAAFEFDLVARAGCHIVPVNTFNHHDGDDDVSDYNVCDSDDASNSGGGNNKKKTTIPPEYYYPNASSLNAAYQRTIQETGSPPRVLLLSHPNNPLGICYPPSVISECIDWCRSKEVHLISDEIYAGSVYRQERTASLHWPMSGQVFIEGQKTFVSAMSLGAGDSSDTSTTNTATDGGGGLGLGPYIHLVYAFSKDFALSGLRVGVAYTENEEILLPLQKLNDLCQISSQTQLLVERMLCANAIMDDGNDMSQKFVDVYLKKNQDNIRDRCDVLQSCLDELNIPYLNADSGLFVWMDFREFLPKLPSGVTESTETIESKERRERQLYLSLMKEYGLLFTPGMSMRNERAGFFRCVFTAASEDEFHLGLKRLRKFVDEMRKK